MTSDLVVTFLMWAVYLLIRSEQTKITSVAFTATVAFSYSAAYEGLSGVYISVVYATILIPFILISSPRNALGLALYAVFHCFIALDYFFYPNGGTIIEKYYDMLHNALDFLLIYFSIERADNVDRYNNNNSNPLFSLKQFALCLQKVEKTQ